MDYSEYCFDGSQPFCLGAIAPDDKHAISNKKKGGKRLEKNRKKIGRLQEALYAEGKQSLLVIFQAMDAAGKDGTIRTVFTGINPQGIQVSSFKQPTQEELAHDILWRVHAAIPPRGHIGVFNRSHYEDVLAAKVLDLPKDQPLPAHALNDLWEKRYRQIRNFEQMLYENGTTILKFFLNVSRKEQTARFVARAEETEKNWKFSTGDVKTSEKWDAYMDAYQRAINETAAPHAPWYVIPADRKWYARTVTSQIVLDALRRMNPQFPALSEAQMQSIDAYLDLVDV